MQKSVIIFNLDNQNEIFGRNSTTRIFDCYSFKYIQ